ncbi:hypothetical protein V6N13_033011 [Hibiscus sabdariffa]
MPFGHTGDYTIYQENYNLTRDLKSFLFHAIDKNLAYVSLRFLLGSQSFVMDASEIQWTVEPTVQKDTVLSAVLYYKRHSYKCPGDIIRFCNNAFKHCNDHLRNTGILGLHKKDIESRLSIAFPSWRLCNEDSKLLVYEYMENQSLDRWLHGNKRSPISGMNSVHHAVLDWPRRQQRDSRTPNKKATTHMQQRDETDWNEEATIHICDENTIHSYFSGKKAPYTGVVVFDGGQRNDSTFLAFQTKEESDNMHHALLCRTDNNSLLYHHRLHYKDKDEWLIAVEASQTVYSYFDDMRVKWRPSKRLSRFAQRRLRFYQIWIKENYNLSRDLKSFLFHATDKNLAYVSLRFLLVYQSFVVDASERSKFIVNLEWMVEPTVQKDTVLSAVLYYKRNSYQCPGDIIRFCNNAFKLCNDHLRNIGILGHHKKDIGSRLSIAFLSLYLGMFEALLKYAKDLK